MTTVGIFEAKNRLSELVERAMRGEEIVITRHGVSVARLLPPETSDTHVRTRALVERIRRTRAGHDLGDAVSIREMVEEGRR
jgi:prevent-host-death family protein